MRKEVRNACKFVSQREAFASFATFSGKTESADHIRPLHWYVACRLVVEGGFAPDDIKPRPPFKITYQKGMPPKLNYSADAGGTGERTVLGGLKTKKVDVVVTREGIGPVLAVSCKGVMKAFRNLTNRIEETVGECTNLHITYPALVLGYFAVLRANRAADSANQIREQDLVTPYYNSSLGDPAANDIALDSDGKPVLSIVRFHNALRELTGRRGIREDVSRYEAVGMALIETSGSNASEINCDYPPSDAELNVSRFFASLYAAYDERFVVSAPDLANGTRRLEWSADSPAFREISLDYAPRVAAGRSDLSGGVVEDLFDEDSNPGDLDS